MNTTITPSTKPPRRSLTRALGLLVCGAIAIAPLHADAAPTPSSATSTQFTANSGGKQCAARTGEELFTGLFFGTGKSGKLAESLTSKAAVKAMHKKRSRLTVGQTERLLRKQRKQLRAQGKKKDAAILGKVIKQLNDGRTNKKERLEAGLPAPSKKQRANAAASVVALIKADNPKFFKKFAADLQSGNPVRVDRALRAGMRLNFAKLGVVSGQSDPAADGDGGSGHGVDQDSSVVLWLGIALILLVWIALPLTSESLTALSRDESVAKLTKTLRC